MKAALITAICGIIKAFGPAVVQAVIIGLSDTVEISNAPEDFGNTIDSIDGFERMRQNAIRNAGGGKKNDRPNDAAN